MRVKILAIETSCDETAAAVIEDKDNRPLLLSNIVSSQIDIHKKFGGVVPEVAARAHIESIIPVIEEALLESKTNLDNIDYIAVTQGPGLVGSLIVGVETAKAIGITNNIPVIPINHLEGHIYANSLAADLKFPLIALLVSGGHTMLIHMDSHINYQVIGKTRDDAAGEAFDKAAKILGLPYPGGPAISTEAEKGNENKYDFPIIDLTQKPKRDENMFLKHSEPSMDFSFSGLKTSLITKVRAKNILSADDIADFSASFQKGIIDNLVQNSKRAINKYKPKMFILSGGVAANKTLRKTLGENIPKDIEYIVPEFSLCTDNAAMIGSTAYYHIKNGQIKNTEIFSANPNISLN